MGLDNKKDPNLDLSQKSSHETLSLCMQVSHVEAINPTPDSPDRSGTRRTCMGSMAIHPNSSAKPTEALEWLGNRRSCTRTRWIVAGPVVPPAATLENPSGNKVSGNAWDLPEVEAILAATNGKKIDYNTCAYQTKIKERFWKPGVWAGRLEGTESLQRKCVGVLHGSSMSHL